MSGHCDEMPARLKLDSVVVSASIEPQAFGRVAVQAMRRATLAVYAAERAARVTGSRT